MSLDATVDAARGVVATITQLKRVYDDPPESINEFPSAIVWASEGVLSFGTADLGRNYHTLYIDIFNARQVLPQAIDAAKAWPDLVYSAFSTAIANSTVYVVNTDGRASITYRMGPLRYNAVDHYGVRFTVRMKEMTAG